MPVAVAMTVAPEGDVGKHVNVADTFLIIVDGIITVIGMSVCHAGTGLPLGVLLQDQYLNWQR